jgi:hypothetical protein
LLSQSRTGHKTRTSSPRFTESNANPSPHRRAELEDAKTSEQQAIEAAAEKAGVDAKDVEKGRKEREEEEKGEKGKKK